MTGLHDEFSNMLGKSICRRFFLKAGLIAAGGLMLPKAVFSSVIPPEAIERTLSLYNIHTSESLKTVYWQNGKYVSDALTNINYILRDFRTDEVAEINPKLLDILFSIRKKMESEASFHIISGYRSPKTNARLREKSCGVARNSLHMKGMAADVCLPGKSLSALFDTARSLKMGGVGYYPRSGFVHVDIGRVRSW
jgi:uncharacterized protein YcbK (DUF882 family)